MKTSRLVLWIALALLVPAVLLIAGHSPAVGAAQPASIEFDLDMPAPPNTTSLPTILPGDQSNAWDQFAWQTFIAMNWPAVVPTPGNGYQRGWPNLAPGVDFACAGVYEGPLVWETFKEKREMFRHGAATEQDATPNPWNFPFLYGAENDTPDGEDAKRLFFGTNFVTLDETVQVASQAREPGTGVPDPQSTPVVPRVFRGKPAPSDNPTNGVRYEVKVNYDFYDYVVDNKLFFDPNTYARSLKLPPVQLPWRTSLADPGVKFYTQKPAETNYVSGYNAAATLATYRQRPVTGGTPPRLGAIHLKAAWVPITEGEADHFISREAEYFVTGDDGEPQSRTGLFGLVGLHIIQRIKIATSEVPGGEPVPNLNNVPIGGTFIYSTWEHVEIENPPPGTVPRQPYFYTNYYLSRDGKFVPSPPLSSPYTVSRFYPILEHTNVATQALWDQLRPMKCGQQNKPSVWLNYRLVGTQFMPFDITDDPDVPTHPGTNDRGGLPVYLANLVIETNLGLQNFQGLPPGALPAPQFELGGIAGNPTGNFDHLASNLRFGVPGNNVKTSFNMGGCMGCHGVAQIKGYSFSFVLLGGQAGADPDTAHSFVPPLGTNQPLLSGGTFTFLNTFEYGGSKSYIASSHGRAVQSTDPAYLSVTGTTTSAGERLSFGDEVYIRDRQTGQYLTASDSNAGSGYKEVRFQPEKSADAVWVLYDAEVPASRDDVTNLGALSFKSKSVTFPGPLAAYLTTYPAPGGFVNTTSHAEPATPPNDPATLEVWALTRQ